MQTAIRESAEEGLLVEGPIMLLNRAEVDGYDVYWYLFQSAKPLLDYKEKYRGIKPTMVSIEDAVKSGYGNDFLSRYL